MTTHAPPIRLHHNTWGQLVLTLPDGAVHEDVEPFRCFPWSSPQTAIALVNRDGHELFNVPDLNALPEETRQLLEKDLASREFVPIVQKITNATSLWPPCEWDVITDRGPSTLTIESEDDVRRHGSHGALIADATGLRYLIPDTRQLDKASLQYLRRLL